MATLFLSLRDDVTLAVDGEDHILARGEDAAITLKRLTPGVRQALHLLGNGRASEEELAECVGDRDGPFGLGMFYYYLRLLGQHSWLLRSVKVADTLLATLVPTSVSFTYPGQATIPDRPYVLSRFAYVHVEAGQVILESPLAHAQVRLHDPQALALIGVLGRPVRSREAAARVLGLSEEVSRLFMDLLLNAHLLGEADQAGVAATDRPVPLQSWEFHDLLFHARSRSGRHDRPMGGTFRFIGKLEPPPALKPPMTEEFVELHTPDLARLLRDDLPFARVQESRRSIKQYAARPITARQLGEFLYRVARVRDCREVEIETPHGPLTMASTSRPYPAGGGLYEMEIYPLVNACTGLEPGLYHYDPLGHRLGRVAGRTGAVEQLMRTAGWAQELSPESLQVSLILAARFQRVAWKYASIAYALILKHVGVLYQTMYLAATAMNLAPCAVGNGNADLFARAAGTDYYAETSVGEFLLGSKP